MSAVFAPPDLRPLHRDDERAAFERELMLFTAAVLRSLRGVPLDEARRILRHSRERIEKTP